MKTFLLMLLCCFSALAQPYKPNSLNTNVLGTNVVWDPLSGTLTISSIGPGIVLHNTAGGVNNKRFYLTSAANRFQLNWASDNSLSSLTLGDFDTNGNLLVHGYIGMSNRTNQLTISSTNTLLLDGVPIVTGGTTVTNTIINSTTINSTTINSTTNIFNTAKGGHLTITNYVLFPWTTLAYSGSNVTVNLTNSMFKLTLTNDAFFVAPTGLPGTNLAQTIQVHLLQDGTGGRTVTLTNSAWLMAGAGASTNAVPTITTNANAVTILTFVSSPFDANKLYGVPSPFTP